MGLSALVSCSAVPQSPATPAAAPAEHDISGTLEQRLAHAKSQAESEDGDCVTRLQAAQRDYDLAAADPRLDVLIPRGRALLADIDYRLHLGRASCGALAKSRKDELLAAAGIAQKAVQLHRADYDYQAMAVMQYDVAAAYRLMGDTDKAVAALETAIAMDAKFGFAEDAEDNAKVLQGWKGGPTDAAQMVPAVPKRSVTLKFAWEPRDADVSVQADYLGLEEGRVAHVTAETTLVRHVRADGEGWSVSSDVADRRYNFADWRDRSAASMVRTIVAQAAEQMWPPDMRVRGNGEFKDIADAGTMALNLADDVDKVSRDLKLDREGEADLTSAFGRSMQLLARPDGLQVRGAEDYTLAVSAWIDATLDQGVWYEMTVPLLLPGIATLVDHDVQFAYSRPVPCAGGEAEAKCAEILVHATPDPDGLQDKLDYIKRGLRLDHPIRYEAATDLRLVVDPARLQPYVSETRRHWYLDIDGKGNPLVGVEKVVSSYTYR